MKLDLGHHISKHVIAGPIPRLSDPQRRLTRLWIVGAIFLALAFAVAALPSLIAAAYHAAGAQALAESVQTSDPAHAVRAAGYLEQARSWAPADPEIQRALAASYLRLDQPQKAMEALEQAFRLRPESLLIQHELAQAYMAGGQVERARLIWTRAGLTPQHLLVLSGQANRARHYEEASHWYKQAVLLAGEPLDTFPSPLEDQAFVLESYASQDAWRACSWCRNAPDGQFAVHQGVLEITYPNAPDRREGFVVRSAPDIPVDQFSQLSLRLRGEPGTLVTIEIVVDGKRSRPFSYQPAPGEWEVWTVPLAGKTLSEILIGAGELQSNPPQEGSRLFLDWIVLR